MCTRVVLEYYSIPVARDYYCTRQAITHELKFWSAPPLFSKMRTFFKNRPPSTWYFEALEPTLRLRVVSGPVDKKFFFISRNSLSHTVVLTTSIEVLFVKVTVFILLLFATLPECSQNQTAVSDTLRLLSDF